MACASEKHRRLYAQIPTFECKKGCTLCCKQPVPFSKWEWEKLGDKQLPETPLETAIKLPDMEAKLCYKCPYSVGGHCSIYEDRPLMCRLFGSMEGLPCPIGYGPEKPLTKDQAQKLIVEYRKLAGNGLGGR